MRLQTISKSQFTGLDDKKFLKKKKEKKKETHIHFHIKEKKEKYLNAEVKAVRHCKRLQVLRFILLQAPVLHKLNSNLVCKSITNLPSKNYVLS